MALYADSNVKFLNSNIYEQSSTVVINILFKNVELHSRRNRKQYLCFLFLIFYFCSSVFSEFFLNNIY